MITIKGWQLNEKEKKDQRTTGKELEETLDVYASPPLRPRVQAQESSLVEMTKLMKEMAQTKSFQLITKHFLFDHICI